MEYFAEEPPPSKEEDRINDRAFDGQDEEQFERNMLQLKLRQLNDLLGGKAAKENSRCDVGRSKECAVPKVDHDQLFERIFTVVLPS